jgi:hypothetical protein
LEEDRSLFAPTLVVFKSRPEIKAKDTIAQVLIRLWSKNIAFSQ